MFSDTVAWWQVETTFKPLHSSKQTQRSTQMIEIKFLNPPPRLLPAANSIHRLLLILYRNSAADVQLINKYINYWEVRKPADVILFTLSDLFWQRWYSAKRALEVGVLQSLMRDSGEKQSEGGLLSLYWQLILVCRTPTYTVQYTAPVLHPLIYRLRDSRCSGQSKQRGSWREGWFDLLQSAITWLPAGLKTRRLLSWYAKPA